MIKEISIWKEKIEILQKDIDHMKSILSKKGLITRISGANVTKLTSVPNIYHN